MGSFFRFTRYIKDFWKVVIRGDNEDLRRQTVSIEEELARLRSRRLASAKAREEAALNQARNAVEKLRDLHDNFIAAEKAAADFAAKLGEAARSSMEAHQNTRVQACKKFFAQQKQQMFEQQIVSELQNDASSLVSHTGKHENESEGLKLVTSRAIDDKDIIFAARGADEPSSHAVEGIAERNGPDVRQSLINPENTDEASAAATDVSDAGNIELIYVPPEASATATDVSDAVGNMELMDVPPEALAQMLEDARKQVQLEEKSHIEALSRNKAILEKEIEAQEAECASTQQR